MSTPQTEANKDGAASGLALATGSEIPTPLTDKQAVSVCLNWDNQGDVCRSVVPAELARKMERNLRRAGDDIVKLRTALNRIAHPASYGTKGMDPREIARRALILGMTVNPLPSPNKSL